MKIESDLETAARGFFEVVLKARGVADRLDVLCGDVGDGEADAAAVARLEKAADAFISKHRPQPRGRPVSPPQSRHTPPPVRSITKEKPKMRPQQQLDSMAETIAKARDVTHEAAFAAATATPEGAALLENSLSAHRRGWPVESTGAERLRAIEKGCGVSRTDAEAQLDLLARGEIAKGRGGKSYAQAYSDVLATPEGAALYAAMTEQRRARGVV